MVFDDRTAGRFGTVMALDLLSSLGFIFDLPLDVVACAVEPEESVELQLSTIRRDSLRALLVLGCCLRGLPGAVDRAYLGSVPERTWPSSSASSTYAICGAGKGWRFGIMRVVVAA